MGIESPYDRVMVWISCEPLPFPWTVVFADEIPDGFLISEGYRIPRWLADQWQATLTLLDSMMNQVELMIQEAKMPSQADALKASLTAAIPDGPQPTEDHPAQHLFTVTHTVSAEGSDVPFSVRTSDPGTPDDAVAFIRDRLLFS